MSTFDAYGPPPSPIDSAARWNAAQYLDAAARELHATQDTEAARHRAGLYTSVAARLLADVGWDVRELDGVTRMLTDGFELNAWTVEQLRRIISEHCTRVVAFAQGEPEQRS
jgi:hypothetical protein